MVLAVADDDYGSAFVWLPLGLVVAFGAITQCCHAFLYGVAYGCALLVDKLGADLVKKHLGGAIVVG